MVLELRRLNVPNTWNTCGSWQKTEIASLSGPVSWACGVMDVWHSVCDRVKAPGNVDGKLGLSVRSLVPYQRDELTLNQWRNVNGRVLHKDARVNIRSHAICSLITPKCCSLQLMDFEKPCENRFEKAVWNFEFKRILQFRLSSINNTFGIMLVTTKKLFWLSGLQWGQSTYVKISNQLIWMSWWPMLMHIS